MRTGWGRGSKNPKILRTSYMDAPQTFSYNEATALDNCVLSALEAADIIMNQGRHESRYLFTISYFILNEIQGGPSGCTLPFVDIKTKVHHSQYRLMLSTVRFGLSSVWRPRCLQSSV